MFYAWSQAKIASQLAIEPRLADIQELNLQAIGPRALPFTKISAALYPRIKSDYTILSTGAALGIGCGPLIVGPDSGGPLSGRKLAHPGIHTTAYQLTRMALGIDPERLIEMRYDEILPAVIRGEVGAGVIIHESRFVLSRTRDSLACSTWETGGRRKPAFLCHWESWSPSET